MGELLINGVPFVFEDIDLSTEKSKVLDKEIAKENLLIYKKILDENSVRFLLMHGTLLGAMREHDFIDWDCDVDTYVYDEQALINVIPLLSQAGLQLCRYSKIEYSFIRKGVYIDAFISRPCRSILLRPFFCQYQFGRFPKKYFANTEMIEFLGTEFEVSKNPQKLLEYFYGSDWNIPKKNANSLNGDRMLFYSFSTVKVLKKLIHYLVNGKK